MKYLKIYFCCLVLAIGAVSCGSKTSHNDDVIQVVAGTQPYASIADFIGGGYVNVTTLIPPGKNPHTFDLDPRHLQAVMFADLAVFNGAGLEMWADRISESFENPDVKVLWAGELLADEAISSSHTGHHHHDHDVNPHFWLDPMLMKRVAFAIRDSLSSIKPEGADLFAANAENYSMLLDSLDAEIRSTSQHWKQRSFITIHSAWAYFCKRYDLNEFSAVEASPGKEISAKEMSSMIQVMNENGINVVFGQYMYHNGVIRALANETHSRLVILDPNGSPNTATSYIGLMKYNLKLMDESLR